MKDIGGGWYLKKCARGLPPWKRTKLSKKAKDRHDIIFKNFMNLIGGGMIGNSNCIGTSLNGLIQNQPIQAYSNVIGISNNSTTY